MESHRVLNIDYKKFDNPILHQPLIVKNTVGSSAGVGSGDLHIYRTARKKEADRLAKMDYEVRKEVEAKQYADHVRRQKEEEQQKLEKKRARRQKRKQAKQNKIIQSKVDAILEKRNVEKQEALPESTVAADSSQQTMNGASLASEESLSTELMKDLTASVASFNAIAKNEEATNTEKDVTASEAEEQEPLKRKNEGIPSATQEKKAKIIDEGYVW